MKAWFLSLSAREQRLVSAGAALVAALLIYLFWLEPRYQRLEAARLKAQSQLELHRVVARAAALRASHPGDAVPRDQQSLLALIDATSRKAGVDQAVRRIQPVDADSVQVWLEEVAFDPAIVWAMDLDGRPGLAVAEFTARKRGPGMAEISFRLHRR